MSEERTQKHACMNFCVFDEREDMSMKPAGRNANGRRAAKMHGFSSIKINFRRKITWQ